MTGARAALRVAAVGLALALFPSAVGAEEPAPATDAPAVDPATGDEVGPLPAGDGSTTTAAAAVAASVIEVSGHGFGHGRGMGQYGALGYSLAPFNWPASRILQHYYSNTAPGNVGNGPLDVVLSAPGATTSTGMSGSTIVRLDRGNPLISVNGAAPFAAPAQAVHITRTASGFFQVRYGASCTGPWGPTSAAGAERIAVLPARPPGDLADSLQVCDGAMTGGNPADRRWVRGEVQAVSSVSRQYTVNRVFLDAYLQGVVPRESPASWPAAALQAQSVAARSYALADARSRTPGTYPWVATCDTISCQVYGGRQQQRGGVITGEVASTDSAVAVTSGQVRLLNGAVARTEFSSSTGGWSAGGTFPAVEDLGDATPSNTRHDWQVSLDRSRIEASFGLGTLQSLQVLSRNGLGEDGGRVVTVRLVFSGGTRDISGNDFRSRFGLFSDWFSFYDREADRRYVAKAYLDLLGRAVDPGGLDYWSDVVRTQGRQAFTRGLVFSPTCEWPRRVVNQLYIDILGRPADPDGLAYWSGRICRGETARAIASEIYGGSEYFRTQGGNTVEGYVRALYDDVLGRTAEPSEVTFWSGEVRRRGIVAVAADLYQSLESRQRRVRRQYDDLLRRPVDQSGLNYWAAELARVDDLVLTVSLTAMDEYYFAPRPG